MSNAVVGVAENALNYVFGERHFALRCILTSSMFTVGSILFLIILSGAFSLSVSFLGNPQLNKFLELYWSFPFSAGAPGFLTWMVWSIVIDYFSLLKTRLLIRLLRKWGALSLIICIADFSVGFIIYAIGICLLSLLSLLVHNNWYHPPIVSLETGVMMSMVAVLYGKAALPHLQEMLAAKGQLTPQAFALLHSDAPQTLLLMLLLVQIFPFVTIGSDLFYASMMPSIWLWLFCGSVFAAKLLSWVAAYIEFAFSRFKKKDRTMEITGRLITPIIVISIFIATLWPYALGVLFFAARAVLALMGLLAEHLQSVTPHP